jgi:hypothetical protein
MKITPKILESIYLTLAKCDPFIKWDLPPSELCRFGIVDDHTVMATYEYDDSLAKPHIFSISQARCGHYDTIVRSMAHEMIHCSRHKSGKWTLHDTTFKRRKTAVGLELGFDPKEL